MVAKSSSVQVSSTTPSCAFPRNYNGEGVRGTQSSVRQFLFSQSCAKRARHIHDHSEMMV